MVIVQPDVKDVFGVVLEAGLPVTNCYTGPFPRPPVHPR